MFGNYRWPRASAVSARILDFGSRYARLMGIIWFSIEANPSNGSLVAKNRYWYKRFCLLSRLAVCCTLIHIRVIQNLFFVLHNVIFMIQIRLFFFFICSTIIVCMQFCFGQQILRVVNDFLRLFRRVRSLPGCEDMGFGGKRELSLLLVKILCVCYEILWGMPMLFSKFDVKFSIEILCDIYTSLSESLITHSCFLGFLSVGALYDQVNRYVRHELRRQLRSLEQLNGGQPSRRQLKSATYRLDECLAIYDEIQRVSSSFQQLMDVPLCLIFLILFLSMSIISHYFLSNGFRSLSLWLLVIKVFVDMVLLTLAVHGASNSSRVIRRLSLENCYVCERNDWQIRLEMFLSRLNFFEFRVRPMGLFEVSNELILVFLSGLVTYLTYLLQSDIQAKQ
ncbi:hypothetical protein KR222_005974 [Zaprionus bogoriensis]|nr:hypothetical protein KR222_005974 [Zaprionus bogoriensis]